MKTIKQILLELTDKVFLFTVPGRTLPPYIEYGIDGENQKKADNHVIERLESGYIDLFTKTDDDPLIKDVSAALDAAEVSFYLNSVQFEEETGLLHFEWRFDHAAY